MNKVITINLNGVAYQLEENGYEALRAYMDTAARRLEGNPDRDEIIADIEQSIADKFRAVLGANKTVVATKEVEGVIAEMGPVEDASGPASAGPKGTPDAQRAAPAQEAPGPAKRLFKVHDGAMLFGVCNGIGAYFNIDAAIVRILFVILTLVYGAGVLLYLIMAALIPSATTPAEKAAAQGVPSTAQEFIRRARAGYYGGMRTFGDRKAYRDWKRKFRQEMRGWKQDLRREMRQGADHWSQNRRGQWADQPHPVLGWWIAVPALRLLGVLVTLLCLLSVVSLLATGAVFGILLPVGLPVWAGLLLIVVAFQIVAWPLRAMRNALHCAGGYGPMYAGWVHLWNAIASLGLVILIIWLAYRHSVQVHEALRNLPHEVHRAVDAFRDWWAKQQ